MINQNGQKAVEFPYLNYFRLKPGYMDINFENAAVRDANEIAALHTKSWQIHYRDIYSDQFLDEVLPADRLRVWTDRFASPNPDQYVIKALLNNRMIGFASTYLNKDARYGALLDNLHVLPEAQGHGVGKSLMQLSGEWVSKRIPQSGLYLYVLDKNAKALAFYRKRSPFVSDAFFYENPGVGKDWVRRCSWSAPIIIT